MNRLFYVTRNLYDAEDIFAQVLKAGIAQQQLFVISRSQQEFRQQLLNGISKLKNIQLLESKKYYATWLLLFTGLTAVLYFITNFYALPELGLLVLIGYTTLLTVGWIILKMAKSSDAYFLEMFDQRLAAGDIVIVIDVSRALSIEVGRILQAHPKAHLIANSSHFGPPKAG